jgi:transcriptional regulator of met regulon
MKAKEFDEHFDNGGDIEPFAELDKASRPNRVKRVNVDFPLWMVEALDREARHLGVTRQALVKMWLANCLARESRGQGA